MLVRIAIDFWQESHIQVKYSLHILNYSTTSDESFKFESLFFFDKIKYKKNYFGIFFGKYFPFENINPIFLAKAIHLKKNPKEL